MSKNRTETAAAQKMPAYEGNKPYVFISYRHADSERVMNTIKSLRMRDKPYRLWYDEGIPPGSEWPLNISEHLKHCGTVVCFISKDFIGRINCENEVNNAIEQKKDVIVYALDGTVHERLADRPTVSSDEQLIELLPDKFLGTEDDYKRSGMKIYNGNIWNALIPIFVVLLTALGLAVYGLLNGFFDAWFLPEETVPRTVEWTEVAYDDEADMGDVVDPERQEFEKNSTMEDLLRSQGINIPWENIKFEDNNSKRILYNALGLDSKEKMTYGDIEYNNDVTELRFDDINDEVISLISRYPYLRKLYICGGSVKSLDALTQCPNLRRVYIAREVLEESGMNIPALRTKGSDDSKGRSFRVYIIDEDAEAQ